MAKSQKTIARNKATLILIAVMLLFLWAVGFLVRWQVVRGEELKTRAINQSLQSTPLTAMRGTIYDATGDKVLARSASVWTVILEPAYLDSDTERALLADGLARILEMERETVLEKAKDKSSYYTYLKRKVETEVKDEINKFVDDNNIGRGVRFEEDYKRYYPYGSTASVVIGFTGTENTGLLGIELEYEKELSGTKGRMVSAKNAIGTDMPFQYEQLITAENGYDLVLTLDETVQSIVEKHVQEGVVNTATKNGATAVVMDVKTGGILALAVADNFDLNDPFTIANETTRAAIDALPEAEQNAAYSAALQKQWRNKAVSDTYYPGSVFKMVTSAMGIDSGLISDSTTYSCSGSYAPAGEKINCWYSGGHGTQTLRQGVCNSCNPFFMQVGETMGGDTVFKYFEAFGFTARTGIDLPGEAGSLYHSQSVLANSPVDLATTSFGQNFSITPLQMITAAAAIANGGYIVQPHVVDRILDAEGNIVKKADTFNKRQVISKETSALISSILQENATSGSGKNGYVPGYRVCGKTGTSEKMDLYLQDPSKGMDYVVSFCGFAPAEDPQYALLVYFDEPDRATASGGSMAAPVFSNIMKEILPYLGVESQLSAEEFQETQANTPSVVGKTLKEAKEIAEDAGLSSSVYGEKTEDDEIVVMQIPSPGTVMPKNGKIVLGTTDTVEEADLVTVPDFFGLGENDCADTAANADVQVVMTGAVTQGDIRARNQSVAPGQKVKPGSVITITLVDHSGVE